MRKEQIFLNEKALRFRDMHVIGTDGKSLGIIGSRKALDIAREEGLDLFVVSPNSNPVVAKIVDYGKLKYNEEKRAARPVKQETKEVKISPRIQQHDIETFVKRAIRFLEHGDKVKLTCVFKAREIEHAHIGLEKMKFFISNIEEFGSVEAEPVMLGKLMTVTINPRKR